jgi:hypothetical protein
MAMLRLLAREGLGLAVVSSITVRDQGDELVCLTVYRKGAREVVRRLAARAGPG